MLCQSSLHEVACSARQQAQMTWHASSTVLCLHDAGSVQVSQQESAALQCFLITSVLVASHHLLIIPCLPHALQVAQERNALAAQLKEVERALEEEQHARRKGKKRLLQRAEGEGWQYPAAQHRDVGSCDTRPEASAAVCRS